MAYGIVTVPSPPGQAGKSAYQYVADGGYPGTKAEFQFKFADLLLHGILSTDDVIEEWISEEESIEDGEVEPEGLSV